MSAPSNPMAFEAISTIPGQDALREPRKAASVLVGVLGVVFVGGIIWSAFVSIDVSATGQGRIVPARQIQVIQNLEGGIVAEIDVKEGDRVKTGQRLARIQDAEFSATYREAEANDVGYRTQLVRLNAEVDGVPLAFPPDLTMRAPELVSKERALYDAKRQELASNLAALEDDAVRAVNERQRAEDDLPRLHRTYDLAMREKAIVQPQVDRGLISKIEVLAIDQKLVEVESKIAETRRAIPAARAAESQARSKIAAEQAKFRSEALAELTEARVKLNALTQVITAQKDRVTRRAVVSPVNGVVKHLDVTTLGEVVRPGENILEIVPTDDELMVEAKFSPKDIAFIHPGQQAYIRVTAYDSSIYGALPAEIVQISADATVTEREEVYYILRARAKRAYLGSAAHPLPLLSGMIAEVDVVTGKRTLFDYLLKPLTKIQYTALHER